MSGPNWAQLVAKGRAKAHGVPWNEEEQQAIFVLRIPAEYVRRGVLTLEELEATKAADAKEEAKTGKKPVEALSKAEVVEEAKELDVEFTPEATEEALKGEVAKKRNSKK